MRALLRLLTFWECVVSFSQSVWELNEDKFLNVLRYNTTLYALHLNEIYSTFYCVSFTVAPVIHYIALLYWLDLLACNSLNIFYVNSFTIHVHVHPKIHVAWLVDFLNNKCMVKRCNVCAEYKMKWTFLAWPGLFFLRNSRLERKSKKHYFYSPSILLFM